MKIAFFDLTDLHFQLDSLDSAPLGGSQSAMILVGEELARAGATVCVVGMHLDHGSERRGVRGYNSRQVTREELKGTDAVVSVNSVLQKDTIERLFRQRRPRVIHWHKNDVQAVYAAKFSSREFYSHVDHFVFCSHYQASGFLGLGVPCERATVIPNPVGPWYCGLIAPDEPILAGKDPELLIYASAPNRGLEGLLKIVYPELVKTRPRLRLEAYSGFYLDQGIGFAYKGVDLTGHYQALVQQAAASTGSVTCHPGVSKAVLAQRFRKAAMLCYPTIFRETSCHVALEAMAAGCLVSSTTIGALPETTAGYGYLTKAPEEAFDPTNFIKNTLKALDERDRKPEETERRLRAQIEHVNRSHAPAIIGALWREFLATETRRGGR